MQRFFSALQGMNGMAERHDRIIDQIEAVRSKNNKNWMDLLRLAFRHAPDEASAIVAEIYREDAEISQLARQLTEN